MSEIPRSKRNVAGEAYVWLASTGLTVGLGMIIILLLLVFIKGLGAFWPSRVVEFTLNPNSESIINGSMTVAGEVTLQQERIESSEGDETVHNETQLFVANSDHYGFSFRFFDETDIESRDYPEGIMKLERLKDGPAIGYPVRIEHEDRGTMDGTSAEFEASFRQLLDESKRRWNTVARIESKQMADLFQKSQSIAEKLENFQSAQVPDTVQINALIAEKSELDAQNNALHGEAHQLREIQARDRLIFRLPSGEETEIVLGEVLHFYYPNQLTGFSRLGLFVNNGWRFLVEKPRNANTEGGIFPAIYGTFVMTMLMCVAVMPLGVVAAIYLREYATQGVIVRAVRIAINNLAGVPSIVFGVFGLGFFVYLSGGTIDRLFFDDKLPTPTFGTGGLLWASLTLALMTVPVIIVAAEEALASVPRGAREGSLACGASKWQTIQRIILPAAAPGILTGLVLAMARGAGEVAPLMLVGVVKLAPALPIDLNYPFFHLDQKFMHLGFHIYDLGFQSPDSEAAKPMIFATTLFLIGLVVFLNLAAIVIREKLRRKYATGAF